VSTEVELRGERFLQLGASINSGNSGGPAFNAQGEVIGIVTASAAEREAIGFCIPIEDVISALERAGTLSRQQVTVAEKMHNAESIARRLHMAGRFHGDFIRGYLDSTGAALLIGGSFPSAIRDTKRQITPRLAEMNERLVASIPAEVSELVADPDLSIQVRRDLESLWDAFVALRRFVESPPENPQAFMAAMDGSRERFDEQLERMARTLGTRLDD
jgi:hypothetical protein